MTFVSPGPLAFLCPLPTIASIHNCFMTALFSRLDYGHIFLLVLREMKTCVWACKQVRALGTVPSAPDGDISPVCLTQTKTIPQMKLK